MNTHEYQAKEILHKYGIPIPKFSVASSMTEVRNAIAEHHLKQAIVKIQVHAGGRGKAGGVKFCKSPQEIEDVAARLIGMKMVNQQTGSAGIIAHKVLIAEPVDIDKEYYLGAIVNREIASAILIASPEGGMDIEEVAEKHPKKILQLPIPLNGEMKPYHLLRLAKFMGWKGNTMKEGIKIAQGLAKAFIETDASLIEINPLVTTKDGKLWAVDAKLSIDDNALFRQEKIVSYYDPTQLSPSEVDAQKHELAYVSLEGNIGCMVNGAGLAMATMDSIYHFGGKPANFLDVGGSASKEKVCEGFKIILSDKNVKAIFVNIFGGIMNCATLAEGIIAAAKELSIPVPLIVRMEGTNVEEGKRLLRESKLPIQSATDFRDGAMKAVACLKR